MWAVYRAVGGGYIVAMFKSQRGGAALGKTLHVATMELARDVIPIHKNDLTCLAPTEDDPAELVETWI